MLWLLPLLSLASGSTLRLFVTYMPTYFTNGAAVVEVDVTNGAYKILGHVALPGVFGSPDGWDPTYAFDRDNSYLYLDYQDDFGYLAIYDLHKVALVDHFMHKDIFFVGFTSFALNKQKNTLIGTSPVGNGNGEFSYGTLDVASHRYKNQTLLKFKAMMDDSLLFESSTDSVYVQADYDMRPNGLCTGGGVLCQLNIQASTGLIRSITATNYTVYKYAHDANSTSALAFLEGSGGRCPGASGSQDFWFGEVNLQTAKSRVISCVDPNLIVQEDEWIGSFDSQKKLFATASRFSDTSQLLVFDVSSGKVLLNSKLSGLAKDLHTKLGLYWIWAVEFVN